MTVRACLVTRIHLIFRNRSRYARRRYCLLGSTNMDVQGYIRGAFALAGLAIGIMILNWFGTPEQDTLDPIVKVTDPAKAPVDDTPACVAKGVDLAPPVYASAPNAYGIDTRHVFGRLVEYDRRSGQIVPGLATHWKVTDDKMTYTFYLRKHVNFHTVPGYTPTRAFNANDVLFTFSRLIVESNPYYRADGSDRHDYKTVDMPSLIHSVTRKDQREIEIQLSVPYAKFLSNLSMDFASIQSREYADAMEKAGTPEKFFTQPVGTGPFVVQSTAAPVTYTANPTYWADYIPELNPKSLKQQMAPQEIIGTD